MKKKIGLYWFTFDLRLHDNSLLVDASSFLDELVCLYCRPSVTPFLHHFAQEVTLGRARRKFIDASLCELNDALGQLGQRLWTLDIPPYQALKYAIQYLSVTHLYADAMAGSDEQNILHKLQDEYPHLVIVQHAVRSLFDESKLPFTLPDLPETFTQFRKCVEGIDIAHPIDAPSRLPPMPK
ncbi:deoxyribodipyrimidine photo-lyase, partial [Vibrio parahaemolyticus]